MTHEDYERAANYWKIKDASDEKMDRDTLLKEIEQYIKSNNTCAAAPSRTRPERWKDPEHAPDTAGTQCRLSKTDKLRRERS